MSRRRMMTDFPMPWLGQYILGGEEGHTPIPCYSLYEWGRWLESEARIVDWTGSTTFYVSTVFLGLDQRMLGKGPPIVFETMVFRNGRGDECEQYSSWDDAEAGHKAMARRVFGKLEVVDETRQHR